MNKGQFERIIEDPSRLSYVQDLPLLKELIESFPYFPASYVMLTRLLYREKSIYTEKYIKLSAAYIGDRGVLYNYLYESGQIAGESPEEEPVPALEERPASEKIVREARAAGQDTLTLPEEDFTQATSFHEGQSELQVPTQESYNPEPGSITEEEKTTTSRELPVEKMISQALTEEPISESKPQETKFSEKEPEEEDDVMEMPESIPMTPLAAYDYFATILPKEEKSEEPPHTKEENPVNIEETEVSAPFPQETSDKAGPDSKGGNSFSGWLNVLSKGEKIILSEINNTKPVAEANSSGPVAPGSKKPQKQDATSLIDKFIKTEPRIKRDANRTRFFNPEDMAQRSVEESDSIVTETLARIYEKQQLWAKAIDVYEKLSLKIPEKKLYFAGKIQEIKSKINP